MMISRSHLLRPFLFSLLVVSSLASKTLHLFQHSHSVRQSSLILYFPTFFINETLLCIAVWFLLHTTSGSQSLVGVAITGLLAFITLFASASQIGFYFVTGSEVRWDAAKNVGNDPEGRKLILSGLKPVLAAALILLTASWLLTPGIFVVFGRWVSSLSALIPTDEPSVQLPISNRRRRRLSRWSRIWTLCVALVTVGLWIIRPAVPFNHMSGAVPFTLFMALRSQPPKYRQADTEPFPLPDLLQEQFWEPADGHFKGWAPGMGEFIYAGDSNSKPDWAPEMLPPGFHRWSSPLETVIENPETDNTTEREKDGINPDTPQDNRPAAVPLQNYYDPITDPLRITNLDQDVLEPLKTALKERDVPITHVMLVLMESARKDIFPFKSESHLHRSIIESYNTDDLGSIEEVNRKLAHMTPIAELLTGESSGFTPLDETVGELWSDPAEPGMGGINVEGILTGSSLSFKSALVNYCGVGPLPVDFMNEIQAEIYQPCIMHILELFNRLKETTSKEPSQDSGNSMQSIRERKWKSVFAQSITGLYDDQDVLNEQMGFNMSIYREDIAEPDAKYYHEDMEEINYFGFAESEILPYMRDVINEAVESNTRLFLSHFTSTTHHPWGTPEAYPNEQYFAGDSLLSNHEDMNNYLNTVRYVDTWLGDIMELLEETGIANETLVVLVGDHGQAFNEDSRISGTYENGHISNFRIPLVFRHPKLPRMQVSANATTMSILPTILDLLVQTTSLDEKDSEVALDLMNEYEGQSLIRPYKASQNGRQAWNFGIINAGGTMLSVGSAAVPYRLILPLTEDYEYIFSNLDEDPDELSSIWEWQLGPLVDRVRDRHGDEAAIWLVDAEKIGRWWVDERKRLWNYHETA